MVYQRHFLATAFTHVNYLSESGSDFLLPVFSSLFNS
jgi:hypothetical protein